MKRKLLFLILATVVCFSLISCSQTAEAPEGPDGEDVSVASVADGAGLVEDPTDVPLKGHKG